MDSRLEGEQASVAAAATTVAMTPRSSRSRTCSLSQTPSRGKSETPPKELLIYDEEGLRKQLSIIETPKLIEMIISLAAKHSETQGTIRHFLETDESRCKIFIRSLDFNTTEGDLYQVFAKYGTVVDCNIVQDPETGRSKGFGFVTMANCHEAMSALQEPDKKIGGRTTYCNLAIDGRKNRPLSTALPHISDMYTMSAREPQMSLPVTLNTVRPQPRVDRAHSLPHFSPTTGKIPRAREDGTADRKMFVRELSFQTNQETLRRFFSKFGTVVEAAVIYDKKTGKSKGYGFVTFLHAESARKALIQPEKELDGRTIICKLAALGPDTSQHIHGGMDAYEHQFRIAQALAVMDRQSPSPSGRAGAGPGPGSAGVAGHGHSLTHSHSAPRSYAAHHGHHHAGHASTTPSGHHGHHSTHGMFMQAPHGHGHAAGSPAHTGHGPASPPLVMPGYLGPSSPPMTNLLAQMEMIRQQESIQQELEQIRGQTELMLQRKATQHHHLQHQTEQQQAMYYGDTCTSQLGEPSQHQHGHQQTSPRLTGSAEVAPSASADTYGSASFAPASVAAAATDAATGSVQTDGTSEH